MMAISTWRTTSCCPTIILPTSASIVCAVSRKSATLSSPLETLLAPLLAVVSSGMTSGVTNSPLLRVQRGKIVADEALQAQGNVIFSQRFIGGVAVIAIDLVIGHRAGFVAKLGRVFVE